MIAWNFSMNSFVRVFHYLLKVIRCVKLCSQSLNNPDLHFEGAGNGPVVITWIGRELELYSGASPISLVEHCVTFRMIEGSNRSWDLYTTGQLVDGLLQK